MPSAGCLSSSIHALEELQAVTYGYGFRKPAWSLRLDIYHVISHAAVQESLTRVCVVNCKLSNPQLLRLQQSFELLAPSKRGVVVRRSETFAFYPLFSSYEHTYFNFTSVLSSCLYSQSVSVPRILALFGRLDDGKSLAVLEATILLGESFHQLQPILAGPRAWHS